MKKISFILINIFIILGIFSSNFSKAAEEQTDMNSIYQIFQGLGLDDNGNNQETKTPKELAKEELLKYPKGQKYIDLIDSFINNKKDDNAFLNRVSTKVKNFDFSQYDDSDSQKFETLKAVIKYIDTSIDEILNLNNI